MYISKIWFWSWVHHGLISLNTFCCHLRRFVFGEQIIHCSGFFFTFFFNKNKSFFEFKAVLVYSLHQENFRHLSCIFCPKAHLRLFTSETRWTPWLYWLSWVNKALTCISVLEQPFLNIMKSQNRAKEHPYQTITWGYIYIH